MMKFLLFNAVVGVALIYLFTADGADLRSSLDHAGNTAAKVVTKAVNRVEALVGQEAAPTPPKVTPPPIVKASNDAPKAVLAPAATPALPVAVAKRRDEVMGVASLPSTISQAQMSPVEASRPKRRPAILDIAERMELFHLDSLGR